MQDGLSCIVAIVSVRHANAMGMATRGSLSSLLPCLLIRWGNTQERKKTIMESRIEVAPYELLDTHYTTEGTCLQCLMPIGIGYRAYKNLETQEEVSVPIRTGCLCTPDDDPYLGMVAPDWKRDAETGDWFVPHWNSGERRWDYHPHHLNGV
jgi:hypothetical protein